MRAKRPQTRLNDVAMSATKKSRQKLLQLKRGASSSRDTSPPKSIRKVLDKGDAQKKLVTKRVMNKSKKDVTSTESKSLNKDEMKVSQTDTKSTPSTTDNLKSNKKTTKNSVEETSKKKDCSKSTNAKVKSTTKKDSPKQAAKKVDEKVPSAKDEKVSKELKNLGIQISGFSAVLKSDQGQSSDDKIKASISEIVKTKSRTSASHSLYGKSAIGLDKSTTSRINEQGKDGGKETVDRSDIGDSLKGDDKKDLKNDVREDIKATKAMKKELTKDSKKEKCNDAAVNNATEKSPTVSSTKTPITKSTTDSKDTKNDALPKVKLNEIEESKDCDLKKSATQDISKEKVKKSKKIDGNEQSKKSKISEPEPSDQVKKSKKVDGAEVSKKPKISEPESSDQVKKSKKSDGNEQSKKSKITEPESSDPAKKSKNIDGSEVSKKPKITEPEPSDQMKKSKKIDGTEVSKKPKITEQESSNQVKKTKKIDGNEHSKKSKINEPESSDPVKKYKNIDGSDVSKKLKITEQESSDQVKKSKKIDGTELSRKPKTTSESESSDVKKSKKIDGTEVSKKSKISEPESSDQMKKSKKIDRTEPSKKPKTSESETSDIRTKQVSTPAIKEEVTKKAKASKASKLKKDNENEQIDKNSKSIMNDRNDTEQIDTSEDQPNKNVTKTSFSNECKEESKTSTSATDHKGATNKKIKSDVDANAKSQKKTGKVKSPKKSATTSSESKPKETRESSLASIVETIEEVIKQAVCDLITLDEPKASTDKNTIPSSDANSSKSSKLPKIKKSENVTTEGSPVKRKYVKKKDKTDVQKESGSSNKSNDKVAKDSKEKKAKKTPIPKKKAKISVAEVEKTDDSPKLVSTPDITNNQNKDEISVTNIDVEVTSMEVSSKANDIIDDELAKLAKQKASEKVEKPSISTESSTEKSNKTPISTEEVTDSPVESTDCTSLSETEPKTANSKLEEPPVQLEPTSDQTINHNEEADVSERRGNISPQIQSPQFISDDSSDDDDDFFINLPANLMSATFSGLNIDKPMKEANQSGSTAPTIVQPTTTNEVDDSNETTTSSDESIVEKRRKKKSTKSAIAKKKALEKITKKKPVNVKVSKVTKAIVKPQAKVVQEKTAPVSVKSKISVKSLESMKKPIVEETKIKVEILSDDDNDNSVKMENTDDGPSTSAQHEPKKSTSTEPTTKRKYVRKKPLKAEISNANRGRDCGDDDNNDSIKKDVYDFHESGHSSEDTCLSYKKNAKTDKDIEKKKSVTVDKSSVKKKTSVAKKKVAVKKDDDTDDEKKIKTNDQKSKIAKVSKAKSSQQKRKTSVSHSESSDSDDNKVLAKKFGKKKKKSSDSTSGSNSESESDSDTLANASKNQKNNELEAYTGPKRHRMASLNALAKVQCLYENESRTAQELGFVKEPRMVPKEKPVVLSSEDDNDYKVEAKAESQTQSVTPIKKDKAAKKEKKVKLVKNESKDGKEEKNDKDVDDDDEDDEDVEIVVSRTLRTGPGLRGAGKLWEVSMSSMESNSEVDSDESYEDNKADKAKAKKKPLPKRTPIKQTQKSSPIKAKPKSSKTKNSTKRSVSSSNSDSSNSDQEQIPSSSSKKQSKNKRKRSPNDRKSDFKDLVVRKRMASLNASAMLAATYEVERHLDRCDSMYYGSSAESDTIVTPKKIKDIKREVEEPKESRPVSTNVVIVQDTDVTITGVYVNSSLGSSQEAYCKMQYRVQSSVTEERLVRPATQDPPKSYTPLSALSCMLPPGSGDSIGVETQPPTIPHQQPPYHHPAQHQIPLQHHLPNHHQSPDCETPSPFRYQNVYQQSPPSQMQSAFCAIPQPHPDSTGYYQPAGPLINSHLVPQSQTVSTKAGSSGLDGDTVQLQAPTTSGENTDREVLITGGTPQTFHYPPQGHGPYQRPMHQMHCPTYPPANYYPYSQHPQDMCYSPPYQTYYPPKVYPSSYRRYVTPSGTYYQAPNEMYEPPAPTQSQQPPSSQQIVPAGPQHIEHYPPYYSGYSPGGGPGGCYNRSMQPPYIDSSPYPNTCPCPMQSCPKNVHTGPLIGSKTSKGPVQSNHLVAPIDATTSITLSSNTTSVNQKITCKTEDVTPPPPVIVVKPEADTHAYHHTMPINDITSSSSRDKAHEKIGHAPPNFALNTKVLEPEMSISPARGSTGLSLPPIQASATQPADNAIIMRKARVGKSMAREMMMIPQQRHQAMNLQISNDGNIRGIAEHTDIIMDVKHDPTLIKQEDVKIECEDDVVILEHSKFTTPKKMAEDRTADFSEIRSSDDDVEIYNKRKSTDSDVITLEDSMEETLPSITVKKRKILELHKDPCKKSPPNSYKSLIKQSDPKPYLCKSDVPEKNVPRGRSRYRLIRGRGSPRYRQRKIIINGKHKKVLITNRKVKRRIVKKHVTRKVIPKTHVVETDGKEVQLNEVQQLKSKDVAEESTDEKTEEKRRFMSSLELTIDSVAKGYLSDQEILANSRLKNKIKCTEARSKSETKKPQIVESIESNVKMRDRSKSATKSQADNKPETKTTKGKGHEEKTTKNSKKSSKPTIDHHDVVDVAMLDDYSINNNNNIVLDNNYGKVQRTTTAKKTKSRGAKFSNKKRHRVRQMQEIEDIEIPRKSTAAPRWSNGWHWEGQSFKGKVFLNSDDVQVIRTRYPAMRHDSGDVIQPGDCVLLRAGSKKNELPYVAKVASLWENPEDGEMMMSLLWYYRPEHTEQGRQVHDCPDEVFASKHQDHNSVACIEDKCYVLTFNEYCRYRKSLKAMEEDIILPKPIAPCMYLTDDKVPVNTNSELVLFCRRVYEFRLKRLIKNPS